MKKEFLLLIALVVFNASIFGQEPTTVSDTNTLESQFDKLISQSNSYLEFKVVKKASIDKLRQNVLDSISSAAETISLSRTESQAQKDMISTLSKKLDSLSEDLTAAIKKENTISFFGILVKKSTYILLMWTIIGIISLCFLLFIRRNIKNKSITKATELKLTEIENEFTQHRQKTMEEHQKLRRQLQDELNKNKYNKEK